MVQEESAVGLRNCWWTAGTLSSGLGLSIQLTTCSINGSDPPTPASVHRECVGMTDKRVETEGNIIYIMSLTDGYLTHLCDAKNEGMKAS